MALDIPVPSARARRSRRSTGSSRALRASALEGVGSAYITYYPDLAIPGAADAVGSLADVALEQASGGWCCFPAAVSRRPSALNAPCRRPTPIGPSRPAPGSCRTSTSFMPGADPGQRGRAAGDDEPEPFVDADDIADVAVAALTDDRHIGQHYELTMRSSASRQRSARSQMPPAGRSTVRVSTEEYEAVMAEEGVPVEFRTFLNYRRSPGPQHVRHRRALGRCSAPGFRRVRTGRRRIRSVERVGGDRLRRRWNATPHRPDLQGSLSRCLTTGSKCRW